MGKPSLFLFNIVTAKFCSQWFWGNFTTKVAVTSLARFNNQIT